ncbi:hypothetical protein EV714DRAFT_249856, partial [Schizophyllum commune]
MAARYSSSKASTPSRGPGTLELVGIPGSPTRVPPVARRPRTYLRAANEGPFTLSYGEKQIIVGRRDLETALNPMSYYGTKGPKERYIWGALGFDEDTASRTTKILVAFWPEGGEEPEWRQINFGSWDELSPFIHEICVVDKD